MIELLSKLESDNDKWIYQAIDVFSGGLLQRLELLEDLDADQSPENQILQIKNRVHSIRSQKNQELNAMKKRIRQLNETIKEDEEKCGESEKSLDELRADLTSLTDSLQHLENLRMVQFAQQLEEHFTFEKGKVIFKERKTDKLIDTYHALELAMLQHYEQQMRQMVKALDKAMLDVERNLDFETTPSISGLVLNHGGLSNQYLLYKNFEVDFSIVEETLEDNHKTIHQYYQLQIQHMMKQGKQALSDVWEAKQNHYRTAEKELEETKQKIDMNKEQLKDLQEKLDQAIWEWNPILDQALRLDEILKEEFVTAVSELEAQLLTPDLSVSEKWAYHQYGQIMLKQAERIIGNDDN
jgi:seryl-tRNA synthetase